MADALSQGMSTADGKSDDVPFWRRRSKDLSDSERWTSSTVPDPAEEFSTIELVPLRRQARSTVECHKASCRRRHEEGRGEQRGLAWQPCDADALPPLAGRYITTRSFESDCKVRSKVLGTGASGKVQLAECRQTRRKFAVKSFQKGKLTSQAWKELKSEVQVYLSVDHPNIARLERVYDKADNLHLVMECLEGGELFDWVVRLGPYPEREAASVAQQVFQAVAYLHAHHVIHRDLKLENLVYESRDSRHVKLIDFGYATRWDGNSKLSHRCGSLQYVAPEVLARAYTEKADLWSVGVLLYVLLTGQPLHHGSESSLPEKIQSGKLEFSQSFFRLSDYARSLVESLLAFNPKERPSAAHALKHPWFCKYDRPASTLDPAVMDGLRNFAGAPKLRRACFRVMASLLPSKDQATLLKQFRMLDSDHQGVVTLTGLKRALGPSCDAEAEAIFASIDINNDGEITWSEFLAATMSEKSSVQKDVSRAAFCLFDHEPGSAITASTISNVLGGALGSSMFDDVDAAKGNDGRILFRSHAEFHSYLKQSGSESPGQEEDLPKRALMGMTGISSVNLVKGSLRAERCLPLRASFDLILSQWWASFKLAHMVSV